MESPEACEPLTAIEVNRPSQESMYQTWNAIKTVDYLSSLLRILPTLVLATLF